MNLQEQEQFYQTFRRSRAASSSTEDKRITEVVNGIITTRPAKKIEYLSTKETQAIASEPIVIDLQQQKSKAGSVPGIDKMKAIHDFIRSNGRH